MALGRSARQHVGVPRHGSLDIMTRAALTRVFDFLERDANAIRAAATGAADLLEQLAEHAAEGIGRTRPEALRFIAAALTRDANAFGAAYESAADALAKSLSDDRQAAQRYPARDMPIERSGGYQR
jgi:hypothetical protein